MIYIADIVVGFNETMQDVSESKSGFTSCVSILSGNPEPSKDIIVSLASTDGTATGNLEYYGKQVLAQRNDGFFLSYS